MSGPVDSARIAIPGVPIVDVGKQLCGKIWQRRPCPQSHDGVICRINHCSGTAFSLQPRIIRFQQFDFDQVGDKFIAGDQQGNIYTFDISKNRYELVQRTGTCPTALCFTLKRNSEFLVAMPDSSLKCFDTQSKELVSWMKGHNSAINRISLDSAGRYCITTASDASQLWDLDSFTKKRKLNVGANVGILDVFFVPSSKTIVTCFKDDSVFGWEAETFDNLFQLPVPQSSKPHYRCFSVSKDGVYMAAAGMSQNLHLWNLHAKRLHRIIQFPDKVRVIKQVQFLPDVNFDGGRCQVAGALCQDGLVRFINIDTFKLIFDIGSLADPIQNFLISPTGRHVVCVTDKGCLDLYSVSSLTTRTSQPPLSLVKKLQETPANLHGPANRQKSRVIDAKQSSINRPTLNTSTELPVLDAARLRRILRAYGAFPDKYREYIWRLLLKLPENHDSFNTLVSKGTHGAFANSKDDYPIKSEKLSRVLQRCLSVLAHWSPVFGEVPYLPIICFPFAKMFQNNLLVCFEIIATLITNWFGLWFEFLPNPPLNILNMAENMLAHHDKQLLKHFVSNKLASTEYAWPILGSLFSEVLSKQEWLIMWDNILANHPGYFICCLIGYLTASRSALLYIQHADGFEYFFHHHNAIDVSQIIREADRIYRTTPDDIHPKKFMDAFRPLPSNQYPVFARYPKYVVNYQIQERERIRQQELEFSHERALAEQLNHHADQRLAEEEAWFRQQDMMKAAEEQRRHILKKEEEKLIEQRRRLTAMKREVRVREQRLLDATRRRFLAQQTGHKEMQLARIDEEIERKRAARECETSEAMQEVEVEQLELEAKRMMLQQQLSKFSVEASQQLCPDPVSALATPRTLPLTTDDSDLLEWDDFQNRFPSSSGPDGEPDEAIVMPGQFPGLAGCQATECDASLNGGAALSVISDSSSFQFKESGSKAFERQELELLAEIRNRRLKVVDHGRASSFQ